VGEKRKGNKSPPPPQFNTGIHDALYNDMPCIVCLKKIDVRLANNGYMHKECEEAGSTGKVVYPTPTSEPTIPYDGLEA
jgi:hypothetical protein